MARTKKVPFIDSLAVWCETASEEEIRDGAVMLNIYARQRKFQFRVRLEAAPVEKQLPLLEGK